MRRFSIVLVALVLVACTRARPSSMESAPEASTPTDSGPRVTLACLSAEQPPGTTQVAGKLADVVFRAEQVKAGEAAYYPTFTLKTDDAHGVDANGFREDLEATFKEQYEETKRTASVPGVDVKSFAPPTSTPSRVAGLPGHRWQVETLASFAGHKVHWRSVSLTTVYRDTAYVVTVAAAKDHLAAMQPAIDRFFASLRFDACR
jgi:hypothetical protein